MLCPAAGEAGECMQISAESRRPQPSCCASCGYRLPLVRLARPVRIVSTPDTLRALGEDLAAAWMLLQISGGLRPGEDLAAAWMLLQISGGLRPGEDLGGCLDAAADLRGHRPG